MNCHNTDSDLFLFVFYFSVHIRNAIQWMRHTFFSFSPYSFWLCAPLACTHSTSFTHSTFTWKLSSNELNKRWRRKKVSWNERRKKKKKQLRNNERAKPSKHNDGTLYTHLVKYLYRYAQIIFCIWHSKNGSKRPKQKQNYKNNWWNNKINIKLKHKWK